MNSRIDLVYKSASEDVTCLGLIVEESWDDPQASLDRIADRLRLYLSYSLDGQLQREYPDTVKCRVVLWIMTPLPKLAFELLGVLCCQSARAGVDTVLTFPDPIWDMVGRGLESDQ